MVFGATTMTDAVIQGGALGILGVIIVWVMRWAIPKFLETQKHMIDAHTGSIDRIIEQQEQRYKAYTEYQERADLLREKMRIENLRAHTAQMAVLLSNDPTDRKENGDKLALIERIEKIIRVAD